MNNENINEILNNSENIYYGHGTGKNNNQILPSILKDGIRCSHGDLYYTTVILGIGGEIETSTVKKLKNWEHKESNYIVIASLPLDYLIIDGEVAYQKRFSAFYHKPNESDSAPYLIPEFIAGYYNANEDTFIKNPRYYENLSKEEQEKIFNQVKVNYYDTIKETYGIEEYKQILNSLKRKFPLSETEIKNIERIEQIDSLDPVFLNQPIPLTNGEIISSKEFLERFSLHLPENGRVTLKSGSEISTRQYIEEVVLDAAKEYKGNIDEILNNTLQTEQKQEKENKGEPVSTVNNGRLESKYFEIKERPQVSTGNIEKDCEVFLRSMAIIDITRDRRDMDNVNTAFAHLVLACNTEEDFTNLQNFIHCVANTGGFALLLDNGLQNIINSEGKKKCKQFLNDLEKDDNLKEFEMNFMMVQKKHEEYGKGDISESGIKRLIQYYSELLHKLDSLSKSNKIDNEKENSYRNIIERNIENLEILLARLNDILSDVR